ncbi:MAG: hypothetical protein WAQ28_01970 [Bacteroidia bacterium]
MSETITFLNPKLTGDASSYTSTGIETYTYHQTISFNYKTNTMTVVKNGLWSQSPDSTSYTVHLKDLNPGNISVSYFPATKQYLIVLKTTNNKPLIKTDNTYNQNTESKYEDSLTLWLFGVEKDNNLEERVKKAFVHAIKLAGGKPEAF